MRTKNVVKPECKYKCRFIQVTPNLWLCPHADYGPASYLKGAVEEARELMDKAGGYDLIRERLDNEEVERKIDRERARQENYQRMKQQVRYR